MHDLPRKLSVEELAELFEGRTRFVERLAEVADPLAQAPRIARLLSDDEKREALAAHPPIGGSHLSARSASEQGSGDEDPAVLEELERLNHAYEAKFGFRFVVFVDRRPRAAILPILRERLARTREEELETALDELVAIARSRWTRT